MEEQVEGHGRLNFFRGVVLGNPGTEGFLIFNGQIALRNDCRHILLDFFEFIDCC